MKYWEIGVVAIVIHAVYFIRDLLGYVIDADFILGGVVGGAILIGFSVAGSFFSGSTHSEDKQ